MMLRLNIDVPFIVVSLLQVVEVVVEANLILIFTEMLLKLMSILYHGSCKITANLKRVRILTILRQETRNLVHKVRQQWRKSKAVKISRLMQLKFLMKSRCFKFNL